MRDPTKRADKGNEQGGRSSQRNIEENGQVAHLGRVSLIQHHHHHEGHNRAAHSVQKQKHTFNHTPTAATQLFRHPHTHTKCS